jgi:hypothetical protein
MPKTQDFAPINGRPNDLDSTLVARGSTFSDNTASDSGGTIHKAGMATMKDSALCRNPAATTGSGTFNAASGALTVQDSRFVSDSAPLGRDLYNAGALTVEDSIIGGRYDV